MINLTKVYKMTNRFEINFRKRVIHDLFFILIKIVKF